MTRALLSYRFLVLYGALFSKELILLNFHFTTLLSSGTSTGTTIIDDLNTKKFLTMQANDHNDQLSHDFKTRAQMRRFFLKEDESRPLSVVGDSTSTCTSTRYQILFKMHMQRLVFCRKNSATTRKGLKKFKALTKTYLSKQTRNESRLQDQYIYNMPYLPTTSTNEDTLPILENKDTTTLSFTDIKDTEMQSILPAGSDRGIEIDDSSESSDESSTSFQDEVRKVPIRKEDTKPPCEIILDPVEQPALDTTHIYLHYASTKADIFSTEVLRLGSLGLLGTDEEHRQYLSPMEKSTSHSSMSSEQDQSRPKTHPFANINPQKTGLPFHTPHFPTGLEEEVEEESVQSGRPCAKESCDLETELFKAFQEADRFFPDTRF